MLVGEPCVLQDFGVASHTAESRHNVLLSFDPVWLLPDFRLPPLDNDLF